MPFFFAALKRFQSTLPARGATFELGDIARRQNDFNPRSPHGERHKRQENDTPDGRISIHAPRTGSDLFPGVISCHQYISIHAPRTGSDLFPGVISCHQYISIHAPRTGSDW